MVKHLQDGRGLKKEMQGRKIILINLKFPNAFRKIRW
jgi:hypothetical protein